MYDKFECIYKKKTKKRYVDLIFILDIVLVTICLVRCFDISNIKEYFYLIILGLILSYLLYYLEVILILIVHKKIDKENWRVIFELNNILYLYEMTISSLDRVTLINILNQLNINSVDKVKILHDHYHSLIHKKENIIIDLFSIFCSSIITILPLYLSGDYMNQMISESVLKFMLLILFLFSLIYISVNIYLNKFGINSFYKLITNSLFELIINYEEYQKNYENKIIIIFDKEKLNLSNSKLNNMLNLLSYQEEVKNENPSSYLFIIKEKGSLKKNIKLLYKKSFVDTFLLNNPIREKIISYHKFCSSEMSAQNMIAYKKYFDKFNNVFLIEIPKINKKNEKDLNEKIIEFITCLFKYIEKNN